MAYHWYLCTKTLRIYSIQFFCYLTFIIIREYSLPTSFLLLYGTYLTWIVRHMCPWSFINLPLCLSIALHTLHARWQFELRSHSLWFCPLTSCIASLFVIVVYLQRIWIAVSMLGFWKFVLWYNSLNLFSLCEPLLEGNFLICLAFWWHACQSLMNRTHRLIPLIAWFLFSFWIEKVNLRSWDNFFCFLIKLAELGFGFWVFIFWEKDCLLDCVWFLCQINYLSRLSHFFSHFNKDL